MKRRNKKNVDRDESLNTPEMSRTNVERDDRMMGAGARGDRSAGNEGIDDPATSATHRESLQTGEETPGTSTRMTTGNRMMGREKAGSPESGSGEGMRRSSRQHSARGTDNDRQQGRESTDNDSRDFGGQGGQKEGELDREGTGYTGSNTDESDEGNPLV